MQTEYQPRTVLCTSCCCGCRGQVSHIVGGPTCSTAVPVWLWTVWHSPVRGREKANCGLEWFNPAFGTEVHSRCCGSTCYPKRLAPVKLTSVVSNLFMCIFFTFEIQSVVLHILHHTYLLTSWCRVLLEQLTGLQLVKKFPAFHGTQRFITTLTSVRHLSLSWASPIQSIYTHPTSWRSILILSTHLRLGLPSGLLPSGFPTKTLHTPLSSTIRATCPFHLILLDFITRIILGE